VCAYSDDVNIKPAGKARCRRRSVRDRLRSVFRFFRRDAGCGDWFEEFPPYSGVREPRRPRPSVPSSSIALELPPDLF